jgi:hypothetical protein
MAMLSNASDLSCSSQPTLGRHVSPSLDKTAILAQLHLRIRGGLPPRALKRVREYIEDHLEETISIEALAGIVGLSILTESYFVNQLLLRIKDLPRLTSAED